MLVIATTAVVAELVLLTLAMLTARIAAVVASSIEPMAPALVGKTLQLARELLLQIAVHLALCLGANFLELMVLQAAIVLVSLADLLEVFHKSLGSLVAQLASGLHVLCATQLVEGHIKPYHL
jgi:hypothetical protein